MLLLYYILDTTTILLITYSLDSWKPLCSVVHLLSLEYYYSYVLVSVFSALATWCIAGFEAVAR